MLTVGAGDRASYSHLIRSRDNFVNRDRNVRLGDCPPIKRVHCLPILAVSRQQAVLSQVLGHEKINSVRIPARHYVEEEPPDERRVFAGGVIHGVRVVTVTVRLGRVDRAIGNFDLQ